MIKIYTDGSSIGNPGPCGLGVVILKENGDIEEHSKKIKNGTNNYAELESIKYALTFLEENNNLVEIMTDSQYAIGVLSLDWTPKVNKELIEEIKNKLAKYNISFVKVPAHSTDQYNRIADKLAYNSANK